MKHRAYVFVLLGVLGCCLLAAAAGGLRLLPRPQPSEKSEQLFPGIEYRRLVRQSPRPMVVHVVTIDLRQDGLSFLVTPGDPQEELPLEASTTSQFARKFGAQVAVNGDGVLPWWSNHLFDYYPHAGDRVEPIGFAASRGVVYSQDTDAEPTLYLSRSNAARFNTPPGKVFNAISGSAMLVEGGSAQEAEAVGGANEPQPRTAVGLDKAGKRMILVVVDGRQPGYSMGATLGEMSALLIEAGAHTAMNLDGGGSSTLVVEGKNGRPQVLNSPIDQQIPGRERPVGNHLGIFIE